MTEMLPAGEWPREAWLRRAWPRIRFLAGIALGGVALWAVCGQGVELAGRVERSSPISTLGWLLVAVGVEALSLVAFARMDQLLLRCGGVHSGIGRFTVISFAAGAIASSLPAGPLVASAFGFRQFRRLGASEALSAWALLATLVFSSLGLALLATAGLVVAERQRFGFRPCRSHRCSLRDHDRRGRRLVPATGTRQVPRIDAQSLTPPHRLAASAG